MSKTNPTEKILKIQTGKQDDNSNTIVNVLASGNEYVIYEIDHIDINYRLRVQIDGITDDSEKILIDRFNLVKQKYIEAKGLLYRSNNYGMMKNRVAHTLATCLSDSKEPTGKEFDELITTIKKEFKDVVSNKIFYLSPSIILTLVMGAIFLYNAELRRGDSISWIVTFVMFSSLLGGSLSILSQTKRFHFEEFQNNWYYIIAGLERIFLASIAGTITYIILRSKLVFPQLDLSDYWKFMTIIIASAFSERLVPSMLSKLENNLDRKKSSS